MVRLHMLFVPINAMGKSTMTTGTGLPMAASNFNPSIELPGQRAKPKVHLHLISPDLESQSNCQSSKMRNTGFQTRSLIWVGL